MPEDVEAVTTTTQTAIIAITKNTATLAVKEEVERNCHIYRIWLSVDVCGLAGTGALQRQTFYLFKNPGNNLTAPGAFTIGSSNEKKFVIKVWSPMTMRNQDGNPPYHWEGWIRIPRIYQKFGADDQLQLIFEADTLTGHMSWQAIYKWFK